MPESTTPMPPGYAWIKPGVPVWYAASPWSQFAGIVGSDPWLLGGHTWVCNLDKMEAAYTAQHPAKRTSVPAAACDCLRPRIKGVEPRASRATGERIREALAGEAEKHTEAAVSINWSGTWCPACGPDVACDEDGCCCSCGATCVGEAVEQALALRAENERLREALKAIIDYDPALVALPPQWETRVANCLRCRRAKQKGWPPDGCDDHREERIEHERKNRIIRESQATLQAIAHAALAGGPR